MNVDRKLVAFALASLLYTNGQCPFCNEIIAKNKLTMKSVHKEKRIREMAKGIWNVS